MPRVLLVEDNELNLELARCLLEVAGFEVGCAVDADAARRCLHADAPADLVLLDIQLPGTDGLALVPEFKADPRWRSVPLIAFTAYAMRGDEQRFLDAGCDGYLAKPIDVASFAQQVRAFLPAAQGPSHGRASV